MKKRISLFLLAASFTVSQFALAEVEVYEGLSESACINLTVPMMKGSRDSTTSGQVSSLQQFLQDNGYVSFEPTGNFGMLTEDAVRAFQVRYGITSSDGKIRVGPLTRAKIKEISCNTSSQTNNGTQVNTLGTYQVYINNVLYPATVSVSRATALADCTGQKTNNPTATIRCTWNGEEIMNYASTQASTTGVPTMTLSLSNPTPLFTDGTFTISWSGTNSPTTYGLRINSKELNGLILTKWTGTPASLGMGPGNHTFSVRGCNATGCGAWSSISSFTVSERTASSVQVPTASLTINSSSLTTDAPLTASWSGTNSPTSYKLKVDGVEKNAGTLTSWSGTATTLGLGVGQHTFAAQGCNASGCGAWSDVKTLTITSSATNLTLSIRAYGDPVPDGSVINATNGTLALSWETSGTSCTLNGNSIPKTGSQTFYNLVSSSHTYTCTNGSETKSIQFSVSVPTTTSTTSPNTMGTYVAYINNVPHPATVSVSRATALADCTGQKTNNPTATIRCTWNGEEIMNYASTTTTTGTVPTASITFNSLNLATDAPLTASWSGTNSPTSYKLKVDGVEKNAGTLTSWSGTATTLGLGVGQHTFAAQGCNASGCGAWSDVKTLTITSPTEASAAPYSVTFRLDKASVDKDANFTASWSGTGATEFTFRVRNYKDVTLAAGVTSWTGTPTSLGMTAGEYTMSVMACNSKGCTWSPEQTLRVTSPNEASAAPYPVTFQLDKASVDKDANFTASWSAGVAALGTLPTEFTFKVVDDRGTLKLVPMSSSVTSWTGTPTSLGMTAGEYTMSIQACNSKGCTWSSPQTLRVTSPTEASVAPYPVTLTLSTSSVDKDANFTASWSGTGATAFTFRIHNYKDVPMSSSVTSWTGTPSSLGMAAGQNYTMSIQACNSKGCTWSAPITLTVTAPTTSSTFGTYQLYINGTLYGATANVSQATALADCMGQRTNSPTATIRCTWNGTEIYSYTPTTSATANTSTASVPTLTLSANGSSVANGGTITATNGATTLVWGSTNATSCTLNGSAIPSSGSQSFTGLVNSTHAYTCSNSAGTATLTFTIVVPSVLGVFAQCIDLPYNMHRGYESYAVTKLQEFLKSRNFLGEVTGFYGDKTVAAVKEYQATKNLPATGMVYDFTREIIKQDTCK